MRAAFFNIKIMAKTAFEVALILSASDKATRVITEATKKITTQIKSVGETASKAFDVGRNAAAIGTGFTAILAGPLAAAAKMESLNIALKSSFKGNEEQAAAAFKNINDFASKTPYELDGVTTAFLRLKNAGLDPSNKALEAYGNIASSTPGKTLMDFVEAVGDAVTGENERLKEFNITASKSGDFIDYTFQGVTTRVKNNGKAIEQYLQYIGNVKFAGSMMAQGKSLNGMWSTLKDGVVTTAAKIGATILPRVKELMDRITPVIDRISKWVERNPKLTSTILAVTAALAALSFTVSAFAFIFGGLLKIYQAALAVKRAYIFLTTSERVANIAKAVSTGAATVATWAATAAQWALNAAMYANPIGLVILAVIALIAIVVLLVKNWDKVSAFFKNLWEKIKSYFWQAWEFVKKWGWLFIGPVGWSIKAWSLLIQFFPQMWEKIKGWFMAAVNWFIGLHVKFFNIGVDIIQGIWNGIKSKAAALWDFVKGIGKGIANAFKTVLGIASPSKVFMDYGVNIAEGAKKGIEKGSPAAVGASGGMAQSIAPVPNRGSRSGTGGAINVTFAPVINGGGNSQDISSQVRAMFPEFMRMLKDEMDRKARLAY